MIIQHWVFSLCCVYLSGFFPSVSLLICRPWRQPIWIWTGVEVHRKELWCQRLSNRKELDVILFAGNTQWRGLWWGRAVWYNKSQMSRQHVVFYLFSLPEDTSQTDSLYGAALASHRSRLHTRQAHWTEGHICCPEALLATSIGKLHSEVVTQICQKYGRAEIGLFASEENAQCLMYSPLTGHCPPMGLDALVHEWSRILLYAVPPLDLITPTLARVRERVHALVLIAFCWPGTLAGGGISAAVRAAAASATPLGFCILIQSTWLYGLGPWEAELVCYLAPTECHCECQSLFYTLCIWRQMACFWGLVH